MKDCSKLLEHFRSCYQAKYRTPLIFSKSVATNQARFILKQISFREALDLIDWCFCNVDQLNRLLRLTGSFNLSILSHSSFLSTLLNFKANGLPTETKSRFEETPSPDTGWGK